MQKSKLLILTASAGLLALSIFAAARLLPGADINTGTNKPASTTQNIQTTPDPSDPTSPPFDRGDPTDPHPLPDHTTHVTEAVDFPLTLEGGDLLIDSLFSFDGINPDCGYEESRGIASLKLVNTSGRHLSLVEITLTMSDGTELRFSAQHIAPGRSASVFCTTNTSLPQDAQCESVQCHAEFTTEPMSDALTIQVNGMEINLTNDSGRDIRNIVLYCHNILGDEYFGGIAYPYEINSLSAGESTMLFAADCLLGIADVSYLSVIFE